ncbi:hypothetical protein AB4254_09135 [Vibrio breoganii]
MSSLKTGAIGGIRHVGVVRPGKGTEKVEPPSKSSVNTVGEDSTVETIEAAKEAFYSDAGFNQSVVDNWKSKIENGEAVFDMAALSVALLRRGK